MGYHFTGGFGEVTSGQIGGAAQGGAAAIADFTNSKEGGSKYLKGSGAALLAAAPFTGPAAPFVAAAGAALQVLGQLGVGNGCGPKCVLSTTYANKAEAVFRQTCDTYFSLPAPRTVGQQKAALSIFDAMWLDLTQQCGNPDLGDAGKKCISDRQAGACKWKQTGQSPWPGGPALGACWNWFSAYRDPIANDPVVPDPVTSVSGAEVSLESILGGSDSSSLVPLLLVAGLVAFAVMK